MRLKSFVICRPGLVFVLALNLPGATVPAGSEFPAGKLTPAERMKTARLKAAHEDAARFQTMRKVLPPTPGFNDYKAILHAHAEDSAHTAGTRPAMLVE